MTATINRELGYKFYYLTQEANFSTESILSISSKLTSECIEKTNKGLDLSEMVLSGKKFIGADLRNANLTRTVLHDSNLSHANLSCSVLTCAGLEKTLFVNTNLQRFYGHALSAQVCDFSDSDFSFSHDITGAAFHGCKMNNLKATNAKLNSTYFYQCLINDARFENSICTGINIIESTCNQINLASTNLENARILDSTLNNANFEDVYARGMSVRNSQLNDSNFNNANMYRLQCTGDPASSASFKNSTFNNTILGNSVFTADLQNASFQNCIAPYITFNQSNLESSDFTGANLVHALFIKSNIKNSSLSLEQKKFIFMDRNTD